ncbi:hypothetical protein HW555_012241 [Spodoptera exigua]|uniref:Cuticular protein RR-2 n=1 Tax=Spodoptera exigua TaxID=7107 RepID=A0A835L0W6_SPOEX|nr:hypothetical protein HW555_012241 [Spodoptera exigua]
MWFLLLLLLPGVRLQEDDPPQKDNPYRLPYNSVQFVEHTASKKGPILFPNDAPPPPPTPLIVTSRPLIESIARSELNPNNSIAAQSQYHQVQFRPDYLARSRTYKPYAYGGPSTPVYDYRPQNLGYIVTTVRPDKDNYYKEYEFSQGINSRKGDFDHEVNMKHIKDWHTSLYSRETEDNDQVADHNIENQDEQSLNDLNENFGNDIYQDQEHNTPTPKVANNKYQGESPEILNYDGGRENSKEYNHGDNYAFSYTVKDHKTGDDFSHSQQSTGSATNGEYRVRLPDGRMQIVSYTADENGYKAKVRYDEHTGADNSIDVNVNKGNAYRPPTPITFKPIDHIYNDNLDSFENDDYVRQRFNEQKILKTPLPVQQHASSYNTIPQNLYGPNQNNFQIHNDLRSKHVLDTNKYLNKDRVDDLTDTNNEFLKHYHEKFDGNNKLHRNKGDDYKFSQEISDYSSELGHSNQHHNSKFADFYDNNEGEANGKVTPTYDELKQLFGLDSNSQQNSVSTVRPYDEVTEDVVAITPKKPNLYTNVNLYKNPLTATPSPFPYSPSPTTPSSYLYSTIANLKERITFGHKPVLSHQYLNKINKYLTFK